MQDHDEILTAAQVAADLKCSKAQVYKAILGKVEGTSRLPAISMGRRKLIRRSSLESWKRANEKGSEGVMIPPSQKINAVGRMEEEHYA